MDNIFPVYSVNRKSKEEFLNQQSLVIWLTGLSGSGKSTIAIELEKKLLEAGKLCMLLDGDNIRHGLNKNLGFSEEDRLENIRRVAEVAKLFVNCGLITICSFISPKNDMRKLAKEIIGIADFVEIFVDCPLEVCEQRDVKGLYKKARSGGISDFTGLNSDFESPLNPDLILQTQKMTVSESVDEILKYCSDRIKLTSI